MQNNDIEKKQITGNHRIVITGSVQSGKSSLAWELMEKFQALSISMAGFIAKGLWQDNQRCGFNLIDLRTGIVTPLAQRNPPEPSPLPGKIPYTFFKQGIDAGCNALLPEYCKKAKVIMVDELGPMELQGKGWAPCITPLMTLDNAIHIWIVRKALVSSICRLWPFKTNDVIHANDQDALEKLLALCHTILP
ncbi:NTPase [Desulfocicer vacuolatum DSM 3385]|uniref:NTPase n=1 Tax=Desulfocicer vacuolatum DSM 3385 TaxID=1121400 RepID=A0A1W2EVE1_9BACT|nr:nucleoside-triphosphatase [Desulfocicer vacuolatum]SMD13176.1 NTPase [Desulfocicer vacuolatum DSM 3385]